MGEGVLDSPEGHFWQLYVRNLIGFYSGIHMKTMES